MARPAGLARGEEEAVAENAPMVDHMHRRADGAEVLLDLAEDD
jgi:hypothetical protein